MSHLEISLSSYFVVVTISFSYRWNNMLAWHSDQKDCKTSFWKPLGRVPIALSARPNALTKTSLRYTLVISICLLYRWSERHHEFAKTSSRWKISHQHAPSIADEINLTNEINFIGKTMNLQKDSYRCQMSHRTHSSRLLYSVRLILKYSIGVTYRSVGLHDFLLKVLWYNPSTVSSRPKHLQ